VRVVPLDVADVASIQNLRESVGQTPVDVLINNAGVGGKGKGVAAMDVGELRDVFMVNAFAPMLVTQAMLPNLRAGASKTVIQVTSQLASIANNKGGSTYSYRASKAALNQLNRSLANELRPEGFTCVAIHPGWVRTDMGGPGADLTVQQSVASMVGVLDALTAAASGTFLNYDGTPLPW
jgi:NAD(P)-dependent dehydrogenase (short-subunit alcohol dehydrogenase family)